MITKRSIRFDSEKAEEQAALQLLKDCRSYGFRSGNQLVIAALNAYGVRQVTPPASAQPDDLLQQIRGILREELGAVATLKGISPQAAPIEPSELSEEDTGNIMDYLDALG